MNDQLLSHIRDRLATLTRIVHAHLPRWTAAQNPDDALAVELEVHQATRLLADWLTAAIFNHILSNLAFQANATRAARAASETPLRCGGARPVTIRLLGGSHFKATVPYLKPDRRGKRRGRRRKPGRRGKGGQGLYPTLAALGIWSGATAALTAEVVHHISACDTHHAAFEALARRGIELNSKVIRRIFYDFAHRARRQRDAWIAQVTRQPPSSSGPLAGQRVVVCTDGGRLRIRQPARCGRRRTRTRHRGFKTPWKEPKVLVIYTIDEQGNPIEAFRPVLDATMGDCEVLFKMLAGYLMALGAAQARELLVVADGAPWIWERVGWLAQKLGLDESKVVEVVDWYHASEAVHRVADVPRWSKCKRSRWLNKALKWLQAGRIESLIKASMALAVGRRAKGIREQVGYFERHKERMRYQRFKQRSIPRGSGAVESAVRRVVNLRLKGCGKFWLRENAEAMLLVRSYLKSGRQTDLLSWSLRTAASWWGQPPSAPVLVDVDGNTAAHDFQAAS